MKLKERIAAQRHSQLMRRFAEDRTFAMAIRERLSALEARLITP